MPPQLEHLSGSTALAEAIGKIVAKHSRKDAVALVFDYDRTLTNGYASPDQTALEFRVRGGQATVDALSKARESGLQLYVVTARSAREMILETMMHSFSPGGSLKELGPLFAAPSGAAYEAIHIDDAKLARLGNIYATDYRKPAALKHICLRLQENESADNRVVYFFDDFVGNAYDVGQATYPCPVASLWWDTFEEEKAGSMSVVSPDSTDCSYKAEYQAYLDAYGVDAETAKQRLAHYVANNKRAPAEVKVLPKPKPLGDLKSKFGALEGLFKPSSLPPAST